MPWEQDLTLEQLAKYAVAAGGKVDLQEYESTADLDPSQEEKVEREFAKEIHWLLSEKRLRMIARDFVQHYTDLWTSGKAMMVCLSRISCVLMYDYVQEYWQEAIAELEQEIQHNANQQEVQELNHKLAWMKETEMAVVISQEQNEIQYFQKWGKDQAVRHQRY